MINGIYTYAATAIVAGALAFGAGAVRVCRLDPREATPGGVGVMIYKDEAALCARKELP